MICGLECKWMSIPLKSPIIIASLTPISNARIKEHTEFFVKAARYGVGAIVLPSINTARHGMGEFNPEVVDVYIGGTGLGKNEPMTFAIHGPTDPNIVSIEYGLTLAKNVKESLEDIPVIASVSNIGNIDSIIDVIQRLNTINIDGIELNFSCPNVVTSAGDTRSSIPNIVSNIKKVTQKPLSLKITPYQDYSCVLEKVIGQIDSLTLANAYIGLAPPNIRSDTFSPFQKSDYWAPGGVYGPFERLLTFNRIVQFRRYLKEKDIDIACVGGLVSSDDAIQALLLGANVLQISSALEWNGLPIIKHMNNEIQSYLERMQRMNVQDIIGLALPFIRNSADENTKNVRKRVAKVKENACKGCENCFCEDRLCFAISRDMDRKINVDEDLCSGCGWCVYNCTHNAIAFYE